MLKIVKTPYYGHFISFSSDFGSEDYRFDPCQARHTSLGTIGIEQPMVLPTVSIRQNIQDFRGGFRLQNAIAFFTIIQNLTDFRQELDVGTGTTDGGNGHDKYG
jgi:hypothetical protein